MARILVVDDQSCVRQLISEELILEGHQVRSVGDAELVRGHLQRFKPDLVLLDLYLDGPEGFKVLEDIKCMYPEVPVVIVTAYDGFDGHARLHQADGYVIKSFDFTQLKAKVRHALGANIGE